MNTQSRNPAHAAQELHQWLGWTAPKDYTLEEIAGALGVLVKEVPIKGSEGRILISGNTGIISINAAITHVGKKNFVLAHELGHFLLHKEPAALYSDTHKTLSEWHKKGAHEQEANAFAVELLMPSGLFSAKVKNKRLNLALIEEVAVYFDVSITAAFLRYVTLGSYPLMVVYMEEGLVKWKRCSADFPFQYLPLSSKVPAWTVAGDYFYHQRAEKKPEKVRAVEWFPEDFQIKYKQDWQLWEQCYPVSESGLVSCLWTY